MFCAQDINGDKARDHCHMTGKYRGVAHTECNLHYNSRKWEAPVFCHNIKGYDSHFMVSQAPKYLAKKLSAVAQSSE